MVSLSHYKRRCVKRRCVNAPVRKCEKISLSHYRRGRGRPKMSWNEVIRSDMKITGVTKDMTQDRNLWRSRIKIVEHRQRLQQWMPTWSVGLRQSGHQGLRWTSRCVVISFCAFLLFLFVPTWRTRGRAVLVLVLHFLLVCNILEARFVEHYWQRLQGTQFSLGLVLLHNSCVYLLYFWQNIFKIIYFISSKLFLWVCWK